ncbi:hypothetical protein F5B20DRAFT_563966 [Whalleya microplaca]|nr:hypothetical protein F5B20DRAFT_563966 [Whalleya microplaca]
MFHRVLERYFGGAVMPLLAFLNVSLLRIWLGAEELSASANIVSLATISVRWMYQQQVENVISGINDAEIARPHSPRRHRLVP